MEEQIVKSLLELYKEKGIDLTSLVTNPIFGGLPLDKKVEMIKKYASHISSNTPKSLSRRDINILLADTALSGVIGGAGAGLAAWKAAQYFQGHSLGPIFKPMGRVAAIGATLGLASAGVRGLSSYLARRDIIKSFNETATNPTDNNAIKTLAVSAIASPAIRKADILTKIHDGIVNHENKMVDTAIHVTEHQTLIDRVAAGHPTKPKYTKEQINEFLDRADKALNTPIPKP